LRPSQGILMTYRYDFSVPPSPCARISTPPVIALNKQHSDVASYVPSFDTDVMSEKDAEVRYSHGSPGLPHPSYCP
jgi:hypothetical protein